MIIQIGHSETHNHLQRGNVCYQLGTGSVDGNGIPDGNCFAHAGAQEGQEIERGLSSALVWEIVCDQDSLQKRLDEVECYCTLP